MRQWSLPRKERPPFRYASWTKVIGRKPNYHDRWRQAVSLGQMSMNIYGKVYVRRDWTLSSTEFAPDVVARESFASRRSSTETERPRTKPRRTDAPPVKKSVRCSSFI